MRPEQRRSATSVGAALRSAEERLSAAGVESPGVDASRLLEAVTGWGRTEQLTRRSEELSEERAAAFLELLERRAAREPLQLIVGEATFLNLTLEVSSEVLVPRPETERLVEIVLAELASSTPARGAAVLDVGSGTGAIALAIKAAMPHLEVWASDVSEAALALTRANAARAGLELEVRLSDLLDDEEVRAAASRAVVVVSNPPYLPEGDRAAVSPEVAAEPAAALFAGHDGLAVARRLVHTLGVVMRPGALLALELDPRNVRRLAAEMTDWTGVRVEDDLAGRERFLLARR